MKINKLKYIAVTTVFFLIGMISGWAQGGLDTPKPHNPFGDGDPNPGDEAPIDQAMIWLLIVGIVAAFYFLQTKKAVKPQK